jgi:hypothetical protein
VPLLEAAQTSAAASSAIQRNNVILTEIERVLNPIGNITILADFRAPMASPIFNGWGSMAFKFLNEHKEELPFFGRSRNRKLSGILVVGRSDHKISLVRLDNSASIWPSGKYGYVAEAFAFFHVDVAFYHRPVELAELSGPSRVKTLPGEENKLGPDLVADVPQNEGLISIFYTSEEIGKDYRQTFDKERLESNGIIRSVLDLAGVQMVIAGESFDCTDDQGKIWNELNVSIISLHFSEGKSLTIMPPEIRRTRTARGCVVYSYSFPSKQESLRALWGKPP